MRTFIGHFTETYCITGPVVYPTFAVEEAVKLAEEYLVREKTVPSKLGERLQVATNRGGQSLFVTVETASVLLYKTFENLIPPYTNNGDDPSLLAPSIVLTKCSCNGLSLQDGVLQ